MAAEQREETASAEGEDTSEESTDQREDGYKADESTGLLLEDDVGSGETSAVPPFGHPCSLLRARAGFLGLHGCGGDQKPEAAAVAAPATAAEAATAAAASSSQDEEDAGVDMAKANPPQGFYMHEVITRVWAVAVRRPRPPDHAREGSGGNGGVHH